MAEQQNKTSSTSVNEPTRPSRNDPQVPPPHGPHARSSRIQADIARSRDEMDHTLETLGDRLHPRSLIDDAIDYVRHHRANDGNGQSGDGSWGDYAPSSETFKQIGDRALEQVKQHPLPLALMGSGLGAGLAWLIWEEQGHRMTSAHEKPDPKYVGSHVDARTGQPYSEHYGEQFRDNGDGQSPGGGESTSAKQASRSQQARGKANAAAAGAQRKWQEAKVGTSRQAHDRVQRAQAGADHAYQRAEQAGQQGMERARHGAREARDDFEKGMHRLRDRVDDYPLATCLAAVAGGVLVGLAIPATRQEDQWLGPAARRLKDQGQAEAEDLFERGEQVAASAVQGASNQAQQEGIAPGQLAQKTKRVAQEAHDESTAQAAQQKQEARQGTASSS